MRYKASYKPSFLLCPEVYTWHPINECKTRLDRSKYCRFNDDMSAKDKDGEIVLNEVRLKLIAVFQNIGNQLSADQFYAWKSSLNI
jgi:arginine-tRNA-protein transferase